MGVRVHGTEAVDNIWSTCCALHNWLLEVDGIDGVWHHGEAGDDWSSDAGQFEADDAINASEIAPRAFYSLTGLMEFDRSRMGVGNDVIATNNNGNSNGTTDCNLILTHQQQTEIVDAAYIDHEDAFVVNDLNMEYFRQKLVEHFTIEKEKGNIVWRDG